MSADDHILEEFTTKEYEFGWTVDLEADEAPKPVTLRAEKLLAIG